jgi:hypothetical protein
MKRIFLSCMFVIAYVVTGHAQNLQLHYDLGHSLYDDLTSRPSVTTTFEMFRPAKWGVTFNFTEISTTSARRGRSILGIAREFNLTHNKQWAAHIEYMAV